MQILYIDILYQTKENCCQPIAVFSFWQVFKKSLSCEYSLILFTRRLICAKIMGEYEVINNMNLGKTIRITRQKAFYTQEDFSKRLNVALSTVNRWELNKSRPNVKAMKEIKTFCVENNLNYEAIEKEWLSYSREDK